MLNLHMDLQIIIMENELTNSNQSTRDQGMKQKEEYQERIAQNNNNKM